MRSEEWYGHFGRKIKNFMDRVMVLVNVKYDVKSANKIQGQRSGLKSRKCKVVMGQKVSSNFGIVLLT